MRSGLTPSRAQLSRGKSYRQALLLSRDHLHREREREGERRSEGAFRVSLLIQHILPFCCWNHVETLSCCNERQRSCRPRSACKWSQPRREPFDARKARRGINQRLPLDTSRAGSYAVSHLVHSSGSRGTDHLVSPLFRFRLVFRSELATSLVSQVSLIYQNTHSLLHHLMTRLPNRRLLSPLPRLCRRPPQN